MREYFITAFNFEYLQENFKLLRKNGEIASILADAVLKVHSFIF